MDTEETSRSDVTERYDQRYAHLSPEAGEVANILDSLAKASRAIRFYAANNRALQGFLTELYGLLDAYFVKNADLNLKVRTDRLLWAETGEEVYFDDDRELGIPFRLYRDGIRVLTLKRGLGHGEVQRLQKILSLRSLGKLQEEDIATLLWRASTTHIEFRQVRGFYDASRNPQATAAADPDHLGSAAFAEFGSLAVNDDQKSQLASASRELKGKWLDEWYPTEATADDTAPTYAPITDGQRQPFRAGYAFDPGAVLTHVIVRCLDAGHSGMAVAPQPQELYDLLEDARYAHLVAGELKPYHRVVKVLQDHVQELPDDDPWRESFAHYLDEGGGRATIRLLLGAVGRRSASPERILPLLRAIHNIEDEWLADALEDAADEEGRTLVATLVIQLMWPDRERISQLTNVCEPNALTALVRVLVQRDFDDVKPLLTALFPKTMPDAQVLIGEFALARDSKEGLARLARQALDSASEPVKALGLRMTLRSDNQRLLKQVERMVEPSELMKLSQETAVEALATWALMPGRKKMDWLVKQARPSRVMLSRKREELRIRYVLALGAVGTPRADRALRELSGKGSEEFQAAVVRALVRVKQGRRP